MSFVSPLTYKENEDLSDLEFISNEFARSCDNSDSLENYLVKIPEFTSNQDDSAIKLLIATFTNQNNLIDIHNLIISLQPQFFPYLLHSLFYVIDKENKIDQFLDVEMIFGPLIETARTSFLDLPGNLSKLISFFNQLLKDEQFYEFFLKSPCCDFPFVALSIISSDTAHNVPEEERQSFDTEFISNCLTLIGNYFNYPLILESDLIQESVARLLYSLSYTQLDISNSAIHGIIKALKIIPDIMIEQMITESILQNFFLFFQNENLHPSLQIIQKNILKIFKKVIEYLNDSENSIVRDEGFFNIILNQIQRSTPFQVAALKILNSFSYSKKLLIFDSLIQFLPNIINLMNMDIPFEVKYICFQFLFSILEISDYSFILNHLIVFDSIAPVLISLSFDEMISFVTLLEKLLKQFLNKFDDSLKKQLLSNGTYEILVSFFEIAGENDSLAKRVIDMLV